jgi:ATP-dependent DNA ligase
MDVLRGPRQRNHASRTTGSSDTEPRPPDFDALHERKHDKRAQFYAFDMLAGGGEDVRPQALALRKANFARLLKRPLDGIFIAEYEQGGAKVAGCGFGSDIGDVLFRVACNIGLEGIVSRSCRTGRTSRGSGVIGEHPGGLPARPM